MITNILLAAILAIMVVGFFTMRHWLRRISGRLHRLPKRVSGQSHGGAVTHYEADEP